MKIKIELDAAECPPRSMMNLHHELSRLETEEHGLIRFCQHINGGCYWLQVGDDLYQIKTEDFINEVVNVVIEQREAAEAEEGKK